MASSSRFAALLLLLLSAGCATGTGEPSGVSRQRVTVHVHNDDFDDVRIFIVRGGSSIPIGGVAGLDHRSFRLEGALFGRGELVLVAEHRPTGARLASQPVSLGHGDTLEWRIEPGRHRSSLIVR